ncbi:MAG TPA: ABC transporter substrate-binding protein [Streptosporangiaceae bacterium]|nr:ABC transporter substrate-binding protein [Streptosporangiaceae bacterium]
MHKCSWRAAPPVIGVMLAATMAVSCAARPGQSGADPSAARSRPDAIISLSPTGTEMLYAIGAGRQVSAVGQYSDYPPQAPHTRLSEFTPSVEAIVARRPDLVVIDPEAARGLARQLAGFGIRVILLPAATKLADVYAQLDELGRATGHLAQARAESRRIRAQITRIVASIPRRSRPLTYYYELSPTYFSVTSDTFVGRLLALLGLKSIADGARAATGASGYPQLSAEAILTADPDYIFLADTICCGQSARKVAARPGWGLIRAVRQHHVVGLNDDIASRWGPRIVNLLRTVAAALRQHQGRP